MAVICSISHASKTASDPSWPLDGALLVVKKMRLGLPGAERITPEELETSRRCLLEIIDALRPLLAPARLAPPSGTPWLAARAPGARVTRLRAQRQGQRDDHRDDRAAIEKRLKPGIDVLTHEDVARLDELAAFADAEIPKAWVAARPALRRRRPGDLRPGARPGGDPSGR